MHCSNEVEGAARGVARRVLHAPGTIGFGEARPRIDGSQQAKGEHGKSSAEPFHGDSPNAGTPCDFLDQLHELRTAEIRLIRAHRTSVTCGSKAKPHTTTVSNMPSIASRVEEGLRPGNSGSGSSLTRHWQLGPGPSI